MSLDQYESVQRWLDRLRAKSAGRKTSTVRVFSHYLRMFCSRIAHKRPDELIAERRFHLKSDDELVRRKHEELVTKFILELQEQGASSNTVSTAVGAVRSFYNANYVPLVGLVVPRGIPVRSFRIPNRTELKTVCEAADPLTRTWILCQKDCGISIADLLRLSLDTPSPVYGTVKQQLREGRVPVHLHIVREKTATAYDTFLGEDAVEALNEWQPSSSHIFPVIDKTVRNHLRRTSKTAKLGYRLLPHSIRKYFNTYMKLSGMNESLIEYLMGHSLGEVRGAYFVPPVEELAKVYMEHYHAISVPW